jgi:hypothetical protein
MTTTTAPLRKATADDIAARLTSIEGRRYRMTAETALGGGMGDAQYGISAALDAAIADGRAEVVEIRDTTYGRGIRFVRATDKALTEDRSGIACAPNTQDNYCHIHNHFARPSEPATAIAPVIRFAVVVEGHTADEPTWTYMARTWTTREVANLACDRATREARALGRTWQRWHVVSV